MTDERKQAEEYLNKKYDGHYHCVAGVLCITLKQAIESLSDYASLKVAEVTKWTYVRDETPPENTQLLAMSPYGVVHITSWRPAYEIFNCQCKSENSQDWQWKLY